MAEIIYDACGIRGEGKELAFFLRYGVTLHNTLRKQPWFVEASAALVNIPTELAHAQGRAFSVRGSEADQGSNSGAGLPGSTNGESSPASSGIRSVPPRNGNHQGHPQAEEGGSLATAVSGETRPTAGMPSASSAGFSFRSRAHSMESVGPTEPAARRIERMVSEILFFLENKTVTTTRLALDYLSGTKEQIELLRNPAGLAYEVIQEGQRSNLSRQGLIRELVASGATVYASTPLAYPERPDKSRLREIRGFFIPPPGPGVPLQVSQRSVQFFCSADQPGREAFRLDTGTICIGPTEHVSTPGSFV